MARESTEKRKAKMIDALKEKHGIVTESCRFAGISRETHYEWIASDPKYKKAAEDAQEVAIDYVEGRLFQKITGVEMQKEGEDGESYYYSLPPSDTAIIFYLKTKAKHRGYIEKTELEFQTQPGGAVIKLSDGLEYEI